jgi:putative heme-binding domain-containing protein
MQTAVLSSIAQVAGALFQKLAADDSFVNHGKNSAVLVQLATLIGVRNHSTDTHRLLENLATSDTWTPRPDRRLSLLIAVGEGLVRSGTNLRSAAPTEGPARQLVTQQLYEATLAATDASKPEPQRVQAIRLLGLGGFSTDKSPSSESLFSDLLRATEAPAIQLAAVRALSGYSEPQAATLLLAGWRQYTPDVRMEVVRVLLSRDEHTRTFLKAALGGEVSTSEVELAQRQRLLNHRDNEIRSLASRLWGEPDQTPRGEIVAKYAAAVGELPRSAERGRAVFTKSCSACHRLEQVGVELGPNLASSPSRDQGALLAHILDPNRYVLPNYLQYTVVDVRGRVYQGLLVTQTANSITLKREKGETDTILRNDIEELVSSGKSLMPEGLEKDLAPAAMADLLAYLQSVPASIATDENDLKTRDFGTLPGLIEP